MAHSVHVERLRMGERQLAKHKDPQLGRTAGVADLRLVMQEVLKTFDGVVNRVREMAWWAHETECAGR
jgi:hypothetical protein